MNINIIDKVYYGFICFGYRSQDLKYRYRKGKGYRYINYIVGAQRTLVLLVSITVLIVSGILNTKGIKSEFNFYLSIGSMILTTAYFELSMSRKKLWRLRREYPNPDKYLGYFVLFLISLILLAIVLKFYILNPLYYKIK